MIKISKVLKDSNNNNHIANYWYINEIWKKALGKNIQKYTTPTKITNDNVLHVLVSDNIWFTELSYLVDDTISKLAEHGLKVKNIKYKYLPIFREENKRVRKKNDIGERELFYIEKCSKVIDNDDVRKSFEKAMKSFFERYSFDEFINGIK